MITILQEVKTTHTTGLVLIHIILEKGQGYPYVECASDKCHDITKFDLAIGKKFKMKVCITPYSDWMHHAKGSELVPWPKQLTTSPPRLEDLGISEEDLKRIQLCENKG